MGIKTGISTSESSPRYAQLAEEFRTHMRAGILQPGDRLPSFAEMRARGISQNTMEKVFDLLEREHLIERRHRAGVYVAKTDILKSQSGIIGVSGYGFSFKEYSPYWVNVLRGLRHVADEAGKQILLLDYQSNQNWEKADGVIVCDWSTETTMKFVPPGMPCVSLLVPAEGVVSVYAEDYNGGRKATEYLLQQGHQRIAQLHLHDKLVAGQRLAGYRDALTQAGIKPREEWMRSMRDIGGPNIDFGARFSKRAYDVMKAWISNGWKKTGCTALLAQNDDSALGAIEAFREAKIRVPQDVSVVGYDGVQAEYSGLKLTTMRVPLEEIGATAMRLLLRQLNQEDIGSAHRVFPVELQQGESTRRLS